MTDYTPNTAEVRATYTGRRQQNYTAHVILGEQFDRWLADHDRDVAATALRQFAADIDAAYPETMFIPPTTESARAALAALKPIGQTPDRYSAAGARNVAELARREANLIQRGDDD